MVDEIGYDRTNINPDDKILLMIEDDLRFALQKPLKENAIKNLFEDMLYLRTIAMITGF